MRRLRFLQVTTFYPPYSFGGDGIYVQRLSHALADEGHQVDVIHCEDSYLLAAKSPASPPEEHPNVTRHPLRSPLGWLSPLASHQTGRPYLKRNVLDRLLAGPPYDVIHFHNISLLGPDVLRLHSPQSIKLYTTHEYWLVCPTHVLLKFGRELCEQPQCLKCTLHARRPPQLWRYTGLLNRAAEHVDQFLSPSRFSARLHAERGFPQPIRHLPNFCDRADEDWQNPNPRPHPRPYFLFAGRLEELKGLHTLIDAWKRVPDFDLLVAGSGNQEVALRAMSTGNPRVQFLGRLGPSELGRMYAGATALIVPSLSHEIFALVVVEALARKTPFIARNLGGLTELAEDSEAGLLYQTEDELIEHVRRLGANPALAREMGARGYQRFLDRWSREAHLRLYAEVLREVAMRKFGRIPWHD